VPGKKNSKKKQKHLAPENLDSRTQIFGFSGKSTSSGIGNESPKKSEEKGQQEDICSKVSAPPI